MPSSLTILRRSAAELLACAALEVFPQTKLLGGRATDIGFFYDFVFPQSIDDRILSMIEEEVISVIKKKILIKPIEMMRENAVEFFKHHHQGLLANIVSADPKNIVEIFQMEGFCGYSPAPYLKNSKEVGACKLLSFSSRNEDEREVTRIIGTAFHDTRSLKKFLKQYEAAIKRDHQKLGPELDLFCHQEGAALGCWSWLPKGEIIKEILLGIWRKEHQKQGYQFISTPRVVNEDFFESSPCSLGKGQKTVKFDVEGRNFVLSSEITPLHVQFFASKSRSNEDLPFRLAETAGAYLPVKANELSGMLQSRRVIKDAAHIFCSESNALEELISSLQFIRKTINMFEVECKWYLVSKRPKNTADKENWDRAVGLVAESVKQLDVDYSEDSDEAAIGGPRIEARLIDAIGREWPGPFVQIYYPPKSMSIHYQGPNGTRHRPIVIARSLFGSVERFLAILVEKYAGFFPLWLAPEQVRVIPIKEDHLKYAEEVRDQLQGVRVGIERKNDTLAAKVYAAKSEKIPYVLVVGDSEQHDGTVAVRPFQDQGRGRRETINDFLERIRKEVEEAHS